MMSRQTLLRGSIRTEWRWQPQPYPYPLMSSRVTNSIRMDWRASSSGVRLRTQAETHGGVYRRGSGWCGKSVALCQSIHIREPPASRKKMRQRSKTCVGIYCKDPSYAQILRYGYSLTVLSKHFSCRGSHCRFSHYLSNAAARGGWAPPRRLQKRATDPSFGLALV